MQSFPANKGTGFKLGKRTELDGIRGLSVLAVIAWHAEFPFVKAGNIGVDVFFVMSGFLISTLLFEEWEREREIDLKAFYVRRGLRLFPVLFVVAGLYALYAAVFETGAEAANSFKYIAATIFYVANWAQVAGVHHSVLGHTWSLGIEEQFYLLYPLVLLLLLRLGIKYKGLLFIFGIAVSAVIINRYLISDGAHSVARIRMSLDTRSDALIFGCIVSVIAVNGLLPQRWLAIIALRLLAGLSAMLLCFLVVHGVENDLYYKNSLISLAAVCVALIIADLMGRPFRFVQILLQNRALAWTGRISYGLYLWHIPVFFVIGQNRSWSGIQTQSIRISSVFAVAALSYYFIEKPFLKLKDKFTHLPKNTAVDDFVLIGKARTTPVA
jgi:peptidoglycan/LPS O-acetylase OafA/YrhL